MEIFIAISPSDNGGSRKINSKFKEQIMKITVFGKLSWSPSQEKVTMAVKLLFNRAIGKSPYILNFGKQIKLEIDSKFNIA